MKFILKTGNWKICVTDWKIYWLKQFFKTEIFKNEIFQKKIGVKKLIKYTNLTKFLWEGVL